MIVVSDFVTKIILISSYILKEIMFFSVLTYCILMLIILLMYLGIKYSTHIADMVVYGCHFYALVYHGFRERRYYIIKYSYFSYTDKWIPKEELNIRLQKPTPISTRSTFLFNGDNFFVLEIKDPKIIEVGRYTASGKFVNIVKTYKTIEHPKIFTVDGYGRILTSRYMNECIKSEMLLIGNSLSENVTFYDDNIIIVDMYFYAEDNYIWLVGNMTGSFAILSYNTEI